MREHKKSHLGIMGWAMFLAGAMSLGSCSSDETLESIEPKAITFGSVSMENLSRATDPSYSTVSLDAFNVYGTVTGNQDPVTIFDGDEVSRPSGLTTGYDQTVAWDYVGTQYWLPDVDYTFMAIAANADSENVDVTKSEGIPTAIDFTLTDGSEDLLLSNTVNVETNASAQPTSGVNNAGCVPFTFTHLLSKVHFTFDGSATNVAKIEVTGHYGSGTYTIGAATPWGNQDLAATTSPLSFGGIDANDKTATTSQYARLIIPGEQTWTINLYELKNEQYVQIGNTLTLDYTAANDNRNNGGFIFAPNTQYNILVTVGSNITFTINPLEAWDNGGAEQNIPLNP